MERFTTTLESVGGRRILMVHGEVDRGTSAALRQVALAATQEHGAIDIDLGSTSFLDASGLRALLDVKRIAPDTRVVNASPIVSRLMDITATRVSLMGAPQISVINLTDPASRGACSR